ncbi:uncharacterized protein EV154DRAFT_517655 [Mucor mucedo]|uniref:uncharacterized protein n=1 Tax=Mucor mucedo TaxID=29922 RepID=UPI00221FB68D|nr:uncharacterized protein EV154DRAFT_517655 [Mucor mucedo]KAI7888501.1 hypothetical protein EV154DRAFT_517655 [Mucor mucedo]
MSQWDTTMLEYEDGYYDQGEDDDGNESDYSLDYEFPGPRYPKYRTTINDNDTASQLSDASEPDDDSPRFDMWDDDPYNDFTWESNDMQLTKFMKLKQKKLSPCPSFWKKDKGFPKQLPQSGSSTNHDQSANAICLVQSDYGLSEQLYAVYRDRIIQCGRTTTSTKSKPQRQKRDTTWLETTTAEDPPLVVLNHKFADTHQSVPVSKLNKNQLPQQTRDDDDHFEPFTKYIKRSEYPALLPEDSYLALGFDPQCLAHKYGYMAIGGVEGEFELYCCMDLDPIKIWGTKFKGKDNVMLMTNSIQLVRWKNKQNDDYQHMLIGCMNEAGLLFYNLPSHVECKGEKARDRVKLHSHIRAFNGVPINDAKLSPDGSQLVCVGDENIIFMIDIFQNEDTNEISFGVPSEIIIPPEIFQQKTMSSTPYSSQYISWSASSAYFAHTSDSHNLVLIWRTSTKEILYTIDAAGYTYAISFHPKFDHILVFTNRYGYFHTVNLSKILSFDQQTESVRGHQCVDTCQQIHHAVFHTHHLNIQHEITMVSFRGEIDTKLRILAKINGIEWSKDGHYLYLATKKRVLVYEFLSTQNIIPSLLEITGVHVRKLLEQSCPKRKKLNRTLDDWSRIPNHIQSRILGNTHHLAQH